MHRSVPGRDVAGELGLDQQIGSEVERVAVLLRKHEVGVDAGEARFQLAERGLRVTPRETIATATENRTPRSPESAAEIAAHGKLDGLALYLEIRHWEPDAPVHPGFVIVGLSASLVEPATGKIVWQVNRRSAPVATPGEVTLENAYETAARRVIAEILSPLGVPRTEP